jgi:ATP-dependent Clp protease adaptor protein ClpS
MSDAHIIDKPKLASDTKVKKPTMYVVMVHNDPFTPREFVVDVLGRYFQKTMEDATRIMLRAHKGGLGMVDIYTREIAEMKASVANQYSREQGRILTFTTEEE